MESTSPRAEPTFDSLFEDQGVLAVVKPNRLLVHRTDIDFHEPHNLRDLVNAPPRGVVATRASPRQAH